MPYLNNPSWRTHALMWRSAYTSYQCSIGLLYPSVNP